MHVRIYSPESILDCFYKVSVTTGILCFYLEKIKEFLILIEYNKA